MSKCIFGGFWGCQLTGGASLLVEHVNVVCGPMGHAGLRVTPFQNREKRDALLNHE